MRTAKAWSRQRGQPSPCQAANVHDRTKRAAVLVPSRMFPESLRWAAVAGRAFDLWKSATHSAPRWAERSKAETFSAASERSPRLVGSVTICNQLVPSRLRDAFW